MMAAKSSFIPPMKSGHPRPSGNPGVVHLPKKKPDGEQRHSDSISSDSVTEAIGHPGIEPKRTAHRSAWQNGIAERWVGHARRELLNHVIVLDEQHLHRLHRENVDYLQRRPSPHPPERFARGG